jgi:serine/threonine protein kinase
MARSTVLGLVRQLRLVGEQQLDRLSDNADPSVLVQKGLLTPYQLRMLQQGQGKSLVVGNYLLLEPLGGGAMGQVFKARQQQHNRIVALKLIRKERVSSVKSLERFQREARAIARLSSPHVVAIYEADEADGSHFIAMEFLDGTNLDALVQKGGPLPVALACDYARQAALGLQHAHERGLVHRDIKPANLFLTQSQGQPAGLIKILDFGLTLVEEDKDRHTRLTQMGAYLGTMDYMAPEQATSAREADIRSDLYSLGCTLFYLLTGRLAFQGPDPMSRLMARVLTDPPSVALHRPEVPAEVDAIIRKMLAREPSQRFQTPADVAQALEPFARTAVRESKPRPFPVVAARRSKARRLRRRPRPVRRRWPLVAVSAVAAAVLLVAAAAYFVVRSPDEPATTLAQAEPAARPAEPPAAQPSSKPEPSPSPEPPPLPPDEPSPEPKPNPPPPEPKPPPPPPPEPKPTPPPEPKPTPPEPRPEPKDSKPPTPMPTEPAPAPVEKPKPPPDLAAEKTAAAKLRLAQLLFSEGKIARGYEKLQEIVQDYPDTKAADQARRVLQQR